MKKAFKFLIITSLSLFLFEGCNTVEKEKIVTPTSSTDRFRTINQNRTNSGVNVVCNNCTAKFKISYHTMKSGSTIKCPICKHHYRKSKG